MEDKRGDGREEREEGKGEGMKADLKFRVLHCQRKCLKDDNQTCHTYCKQNTLNPPPHTQTCTQSYTHIHVHTLYCTSFHCCMDTYMETRDLMSLSFSYTSAA